MSHCAKTAGVLVVTTALLALGAGVALADSAVDHPAGTTSADPMYPSAATGDAVFFNATPWTATVTDPVNGIGGTWTLPSGKTLLLTHSQLQQFFTPKVAIEVTPPGAAEDDYILRTDQTQPGINSCAADPLSSSDVGCVSQAPNQVAGQSGPTQYSFWSTDPSQTQSPVFDAAASGNDPAAMGEFLSDIANIQPSWIAFTPDPADAITWGQGPQALAGSPIWNCGAGQAHDEIGGSSEHSESTNVQGTLSVEQGIKLFDTVNTSITLSISAGHSWTTTTTDSQTKSKDIDPWNVGWLTSQPSTETVTGTVMLNGNAPKPIEFRNVSFSEPGMNPTNDPNLNYTYVAHARPMTQDEITKECGGIPSNSVGHQVVGGSIADVAAGAAG